MNEETVKTYKILPALQKSGWNTQELLRPEFPITDGKVIATANSKPRRESAKHADYALFYKGQPIAIVEAKKSDVPLTTGIQQALGYGQKLDVPFVYCSNGDKFYEHDRLTNLEKEIPLDGFPTPEQLDARVKDFYNYTPEQLKIIEQPYYWDESTNEPRYYQRRAINAVIRHIAQGNNRILLVMATGTGKTYTAFQIIHCLRSSGLKKRVLYLADRNILIKQTIKQDFSPFQKFMTKITGRNMTTSAEVYMALYHQFYDYRRKDDDQPYMEYSRDFFDFIIVDECHRGSAKADSEWHKILDYFSSATQLGMTATPRRDRNEENDNAAYFGNPVFTYSLKDGIEDGFLAPYMTTKIKLNIDQTGYTPEQGEIDENGEQFESTDTIHRPQFGRKLEIVQRDEIVAKYITQKLHKIGRMTKTIVFCNSDDEADRMRALLSNLNSDLVAQDHRYVMRITATDKSGKDQLDNFINPNEPYPVIATTVDLLSTGVDCKTCGMIVINQTITSMAKFKQIIGRGTRLREDKGKMSFYLLDFADATDLFNDPDFDGETIIDNPITIDASTTDGDGNSDGNDNDGDGNNDGVGNNGACEPQAPFSGSGNSGSGNNGNGCGSGYGGYNGGYNGGSGNVTGGNNQPPLAPPKKYKVIGNGVAVTGEQVSFIGEDGKLVTENYIVYARKNIRGTYASLEDFVTQWNAAERKKAIDDILQQNGVMIDLVREQCPEIADADIFDVVCYIAFGKNNPPSRATRSQKVKRSNFFKKYSGAARQVIETLLDKYAQNGILELENRQILGQDPFSQIGSPAKIIKIIGSVEQYEQMITELENEIYNIA